MIRNRAEKNKSAAAGAPSESLTAPQSTSDFIKSLPKGWGVRAQAGTPANDKVKAPTAPSMDTLSTGANAGATPAPITPPKGWARQVANSSPAATPAQSTAPAASPKPAAAPVKPAAKPAAPKSTALQDGLASIAGPLLALGKDVLARADVAPLPETAAGAASPNPPITTFPSPTAAALPRATAALSALAIAKLVESGITPEQAEALGMTSVEDAAAELGFAELQHRPALVIWYYQPNGEPETFERDGKIYHFFRVRYLGEPPVKRGFTKKKEDKYGQPRASGVHIYWPRCVPWAEVLGDVRTPTAWIEGELKSAKAALEGFNTFGAGGCYNFREEGGLVGIRKLIGGLAQVPWEGRDLYVALDGDWETNANVRDALGAIALEMGLYRQANVRHVRLPAGIKGVDDFFVAHGPQGADEFEKLLRSAEKMRECDARVAELNEQYAVIGFGGKTFIMRTEFDEVLNRRRLSFFTKGDFELLLANRTVANPNNPAKQIPLAKVWLEHPHRRQYLDGMTLAPMREVSDSTYNLWRGFSIEAKPGDWSLLKAHIFENVCGGNQELFDYFMNWMARLLQRPGEPGQVAIVLRGGRGVGKGIVVTNLGRLLNDHFIHALQADHITGKFNGHIKDCVLLFGDESFFAGNKTHEKILNGLITESTRLSEGKFQNAVTVANYIHLMLSTNCDWAIPAATDERRYMVYDVPDHAHKQISAYFGAIQTQMDTGGLGAMLHELLGRDISQFDVRKVPQTAALAEQKKLTLHERGGVVAWLCDVLTAGEIREDRDSLPAIWGDGELLVARTVCYAAYENWERRRAWRGQAESREAFGKKLQGCLGTAFQGGDNIKLPSHRDRQRPRAYKFGPLEQCRLAFRESQNMATLWEGEDA